MPSSLNANEITKILREGYDSGVLNVGFHDLMDSLVLDYLLIDPHPGLNEETLLVLLRPDRQNCQGTAVTMEVARKLEVNNLDLRIQNVPASL